MITEKDYEMCAIVTNLLRAYPDLGVAGAVDKVLSVLTDWQPEIDAEAVKAELARRFPHMAR